MTRMTTAERRGYQLICGEEGAMMVIACDQRGGMRTLLAATPEEQARIGNDVLVGGAGGDTADATPAPSDRLTPRSTCSTPSPVG